MCAIPAGEGKSALFCTEFSEEVGDAPNSVTNSALIFFTVLKKAYFSMTILSLNSVMIYWRLIHH